MHLHMLKKFNIWSEIYKVSVTFRTLKIWVSYTDLVNPFSRGYLERKDSKNLRPFYLTNLLSINLHPNIYSYVFLYLFQFDD